MTSDALVESGQAIVDEDPVGGGEDVSSLLFDFEVPELILAHVKLMRLLQWFREPSGLVDELNAVHFDDQLSQQLIELKLDRVILFVSRF